jgi:hypothetical protein
MQSLELLCMSLNLPPNDAVHRAGSPLMRLKLVHSWDIKVHRLQPHYQLCAVNGGGNVPGGSPESFRCLSDKHPDETSGIFKL